MKFKTIDDIKIFLYEINRIKDVLHVNDNFIPTKKMLEEYDTMRKRDDIGLKDFRKSQNQKQNWRKNRYNILRGLRGFHKSTKGKRFHRNLSRHLLLGKEKRKVLNKSEALKSLSSLKTHLYIETEYFHPIFEQMELENLVQDIHVICYEIEKNILEDKELDDDMRNIVASLLETAEVVKSFADKSGKSVQEVEKMWDDIKKSLKEQGENEDDSQFYGLLVSILKKKLNLD